MKSCFNCQHANVLPGYADTLTEPGEPASAECDCDIVGFPWHMYENIWDWPWNKTRRQHAKQPEDVLPCICGHYKAVMIAECGNCKKAMAEPLHSWHIYGYCFDAVPCCTTQCAVDLSNSFMKEMNS